MITELFKAWQAGEQLSNPAAWKKGQELTNLTGAVVAGGVTVARHFFPELVLPEGATEHIAEIIGTVLVVVNLYLTRSTTKKDLSAAPLVGGS